MPGSAQLGHSKLHSLDFPRTTGAGTTSASQPPVQVKMFTHALCKLLRMEIARSMQAGEQKQTYNLEGP